MTTVDVALEQEVITRARRLCEYCQLPAIFASLGFELDHIVPRKHGGKTTPENLAYACFRCNSHKGPNLTGIDPTSGHIVRLFDPRKDRWSEHFLWLGSTLAGLTPIGRTTIRVLCINATESVLVREALIAEGVFPPAIS